MHLLKPVFVILEVLLIFNLLIFVHELGHFLAAKWRGLKIERFAVWFGKPIWKTKINGVEYALGSIPAGGYVSLPQMAPMEMIEGKSDKPSENLPPISPLDKIIVAVAGPVFSFLLAFAFAFIVWGVGRPESQESTTIGWVVHDGPAWNAGLRPGDKIVSVDNHPVTAFTPPAQDSVTWRIVTSEGDEIPITYVRDGKQATVNVKPTKLPTKWYERKSLRKILVSSAYPVVIAEVVSNSPAALAGLKQGDEIIKINGEKIYSGEAVASLQDAMTNGPIRPATFTVRRGANEFEKTILAERPIEPAGFHPSFGIVGFLLPEDVIKYPAPLAQVQESAGQIFGTLKTLLSRKSDVGVQQLGGAVMIIRVYKGFFGAENGWRRVLWFSVVLNVNLGLLNLLPFPVLDGGHITLALVEVVRRRPVSARFLNALQSACALLLIAFMLFIAFYDTGDWVRSASNDHDQIVVFAPKK